MNDWKEKLWVEIEPEMIIEWMETIEKYKNECSKLPKDLKSWEAYDVLKLKIECMKELLPIVQDLKKDSIRERHWEKVVEITGCNIPYQQEEIFVFYDMLKANILEYKEDIEDICDSADKQINIKKKLDELGAYWDDEVFDFQPWKQREQDCVLGMNKVNDILERLDEDQLILSTIAA